MNLKKNNGLPKPKEQICGKGIDTLFFRKKAS
jgi:hypothetical protein